MLRREILRSCVLDICLSHETKPWAFELMINPSLLATHYGPGTDDFASLLCAMKDKNIHVMLSTNTDGWIAVVWDNDGDGVCQGLHYGQALDPAEATRIAAAKFAGIPV